MNELQESFEIKMKEQREYLSCLKAIERAYKEGFGDREDLSDEDMQESWVKSLSKLKLDSKKHKSIAIDNSDYDSYAKSALGVK